MCPFLAAGAAVVTLSVSGTQGAAIRSTGKATKNMTSAIKPAFQGCLAVLGTCTAQFGSSRHCQVSDMATQQLAVLQAVVCCTHAVCYQVSACGGLVPQNSPPSAILLPAWPRRVRCFPPLADLDSAVAVLTTHAQSPTSTIPVTENTALALANWLCNCYLQLQCLSSEQHLCLQTKHNQYSLLLLQARRL